MLADCDDHAFSFQFGSGRIREDHFSTVSFSIHATPTSIGHEFGPRPDASKSMKMRFCGVSVICGNRYAPSVSRLSGSALAISQPHCGQRGGRLLEIRSCMKALCRSLLSLRHSQFDQNIMAAAKVRKATIALSTYGNLYLPALLCSPNKFGCRKIPGEPYIRKN